MKKDIIIAALIGILFILVAGSILASFTFYKEYKDKMDAIEQQNLTVTTANNAYTQAHENLELKRKAAEGTL